MQPVEDANSNRKISLVVCQLQADSIRFVVAGTNHMAKVNAVAVFEYVSYLLNVCMHRLIRAIA